MRSADAALARPSAFRSTLHRSLLPLLLLLGALLPLMAFGQAAVNHARAGNGTLAASTKAAKTTAKLKAAFFAAPMAFEPNQGQTDPQVKYLARGCGYTLFLTPTEAVFALRQPAEADSDPKPLPLLDERKAAPHERDKQRPLTLPLPPFCV